MGLRIGSLFSGVAGLELGLLTEEPGAEVVWQAECDPHALAVLEHHFPAVHRYRDVRDIDATTPAVDVVCGGFPCQPHSLAGKRRGTSDARWLWPEYARIIGAVRPAAVFIENVPGLRTSGLRDVLADLAGLGFDAVWDLFSAAEVGAPHRRIRLFILAYANGFDVRLQPGRRGGTCRTDSAVVADDGAPGSLADADGARELQQGRSVGDERGRTGNGGEELADAESDRRIARRTGDAEEVAGGREPDRSGLGADDVADADGAGWIGAGDSFNGVRNEAAGDAAQSNDGGRDSAVGLAPWWPTEPDVGRVAHGVPARAHRLRLLGNACVPAQAALAWRTLKGDGRQHTSRAGDGGGRALMDGSWFWQALGWVALALNVWGNLALTGKGISGWVVRLASNACWIPYGICTGAWALMANHLLFVGINAFGWWRWSSRVDIPAPAPARVCTHPFCEMCDPTGTPTGGPRT